MPDLILTGKHWNNGILLCKFQRERQQHQKHLSAHLLVVLLFFPSPFLFFVQSYFCALQATVGRMFRLMTMLASTYTYGDYAMQVASGWAARMNSIPPQYRILRRPSHIRPRTLASAAHSHTGSVPALTQPPRPPACLLRLLVPGSLCTGFMVGRRLPRPGRHGCLRRPGLGRQLLRGQPLSLAARVHRVSPPRARELTPPCSLCL